VIPQNKQSKSPENNTNKYPLTRSHKGILLSILLTPLTGGAKKFFSTPDSGDFPLRSFPLRSFPLRSFPLRSPIFTRTSTGSRKISRRHRRPQSGDPKRGVEKKFFCTSGEGRGGEESREYRAIFLYDKYKKVSKKWS